MSEFRTCARCQGNGEIVTDWERYEHPHAGDKGDEAVAVCPDCDGQGKQFLHVTDQMVMSGCVAAYGEGFLNWPANSVHDGKMMVSRVLRAAISKAFSPSNQDTPVAIYRGNGLIDCGDSGHHNVELLRLIPANTPLYSSDHLDRMRERAERAEAELAERDAWIADATRQITKLTGGGSEFFTRHGETFRADITTCCARIGEREMMTRERWLKAEKAKKAANLSLTKLQDTSHE